MMQMTGRARLLPSRDLNGVSGRARLLPSCALNGVSGRARLLPSRDLNGRSAQQELRPPNCGHRFLRYGLLFVGMVCCAPFVFADDTADKQKPTAEQTEFFEAKIRPILVQRCYQCHSTDAEEIEGGLVLDSKWGWQTGGDSGPAIVPGNLAESNLIDAVRYEENIVSAMPPKSKLPAEEIKLLERWVEMGAPDPRAKVKKGASSMVETFDLNKRVQEHWSWRPIDDPPPPEVLDQAWPASDIDRFILHALENAGLSPARPADKQLLLRRVFFDLIGLPPTPEQIDAFVADQSQDAYQRVVEQLLDSPQFGEKWARHWMDLVRYAETYGHEFDYPIPHSTEYRDYLIRGLNADLPYDQFIVEHIAGDLIESPRLHPTEKFNESVIGTGFWFLHEATHAPTDVLKNEADIIDNQLDVFGKSFLGLTVACARCHDHKFDAISTADYYALSAFIQSSCRQFYPLDPGQRIEQSIAQLESLQARGRELVRKSVKTDLESAPENYFAAASRLIDTDSTEAAISGEAESSKLDAQRLGKWVQLLKAANSDSANPAAIDVLAARRKAPAGLKGIRDRIASLESKQAKYASENELFESFDGPGLAAGWSTTGRAFQPIGKDSEVHVIGASTRRGTVDSGYFGPKATGILRSPTFTISTPKIHVRVKATANVKMNVIIDNYQMIRFHGLLFNGTFIKDKGSDTGGNWQWKSFAGDLNKYIGHNAYLEFVDENEATIAIDEIWFSQAGPPPATADRLAEQFAAEDFSFEDAWKDALGQIAKSKRSAYFDWLIDNELLTYDDIAPGLSALQHEARQIADKIPQPKFVLAMAEGTREDTAIYIRGSHTNLGDKVPPRMLEALGGQEGNRLELARRIASADNPLTARVIVNRLWHHLFGRGIVPTVDDFGPQGQPPSHPQLLDHLASEFIADGWSIKTAIRKMVSSQTYRQSSVAKQNNDPELIARVDPTNELLHRMRVRRLPAESIRDAILATSGRLDKSQFGGSVPTHRTAFMTGRGARGSGPLDGAGRRTIYLSVYRNFLNPFLLTFDMPNPFGAKGDRSNSNVPAQALTLMNDPFVIQQAKLWSEKLVSTHAEPQQRIISAVKLAHGVEATPQQVQRMQKFVEKQIKQGASEKQAWADFAHTLFNMKSFYFLK